jgi:CRP/FNR family transcriptional regulator, cyclic AMP receptor protein
MLNLSELPPILAGIPWFLDLRPHQIEQLAKIASICKLEVGQTLFQEGERLGSLYIVLEGVLSAESFVPNHRSVRILKAEPLDILGWSTLTPVVRQSLATIRAETPSKLVAFDSEALRQLCERDHDLGYVIMRRLSNVVATWLLTTRLQLLDIIANSQTEIIEQREPVKTA